VAPVKCGLMSLVVYALSATIGVGDVAVPIFEQSFALAADEGVYAYSRVSPDGKRLVYASQARSPLDRQEPIVKVVELSTKRVIFSEAGIDGYWSPDGQRMVFLSRRQKDSVTIWQVPSGRLTRDVAPASLGDYYSWGKVRGKDIVLTILGNYYYVERNNAVMPPRRVPSCPGVGAAERPLISKDGDWITAFAHGNIIVRRLADCRDIFDTGVRGGKADFSWDGRYIAFHGPKENLNGYDVKVIDIVKRTVRVITNSLTGSSLFPSWTRDGRISFRYDGPDYRGFVLASQVLGVPERPLNRQSSIALNPTWEELFPETSRPTGRFALVMVWAPWSAHSAEALRELQRAILALNRNGDVVDVFTAVDMISTRAEIERMRERIQVRLPLIPLAAQRFVQTEAVNQIPAVLLFEDGVMTDHRLGAQNSDELRAWVEDAASLPRRMSNSLREAQ